MIGDRIADALNRGALRPAIGYSLVVAAIVATTALLTCSGCGASGLRTNALVATAMHEAKAEAGPAIRQARREAMVSAARAVADEGGAQAEAEAAAAAEALRWVCAVDAQRVFDTAVGAYVEALALAAASGEDFGLQHGLAYARRVLDTYRALQRCISSAGSDALPEVPAFLALFPPAWGSP